MKLKEGYTLENVAGQQVLLPEGLAVLDGGAVFHLNGTGAWAAACLREEISPEELLVRAEEQFRPENETERETLRADLRAFLDKLEGQGLLEGESFGDD